MQWFQQQFLPNARAKLFLSLRFSNPTPGPGSLQGTVGTVGTRE